MRFLSLLLTLGLLAGIVQAQVQPGKSEGAVVHIALFDGYGNYLAADAEVEQFRSEDGRDFAKRFQHNIASAIPFGVYTIRVRTSGFWSAEKRVRVLQPQVWVVVALELGMGVNEGGLQKSSIAGHIKNVSVAQEPVWIHLVGIYSGEDMHTQSSSTGDFTLAGIPNGTYLLVTTQEARVLDVRSLKVPLSEQEPLVIDVAEKIQTK